MMKVLYICTVLLISFNFGRFATAWDNEKTHKDLSSFAADNSVLSRTKGDYLLNFGFTEELDQLFKWNNIEKTAKEWIRDGAYDEDAWTGVTVMLATSRWTNHFHNPLKPWEEAGLTDIQTGKSSLLWAQDASYQEGFLLGDWSWSTVRACYDLALTSASAADREAFFAMVFTGLGHQMHHIQDMSQPDHVRNDAHPWGKNTTGNFNLEAWAAEHSDIISKLATTPAVPTLSLEPSTYSLDPSYNSQNLTPIALFTDTDQYKGVSPSIALSQGIAEYTNANFASPHTIFTEDYPISNIHYFPYPRKSSTDIQDYINQNKLPETKEAEDGVVDTGFWIKKTGDGENIAHFVKPTYLTDPLQGSSVYYKTFYQDEECHKDYATLLIPRAVGYSAALLNYFFRGNIDITLPNSGIYSSATNTALGFTTIKVQAKNTTSSGEDMLDGTIELVVKYRTALEDPFQSNPVETDEEFSYKVVPVANNVQTIPKDSPVELTFDLSQDPLPLWATDVYLQVVYHGKLGNEDGAVAVGFKDISEPTPVDLFNNMDKICLNANWYDAGSQAAIDQAPGWDVFIHDIQGAYLKISPSNNPVYASPC